MSLRQQIFAVLSGLFLAVLGAILWVSLSGTRQYLEQQLASHAQDAATALSVTLGAALGAGDPVLAQAQVASMFDRGYFQRVEVLGPDRRPIISQSLALRIEGVPDRFVALFPIRTPLGEAFVGSGWRQLGKVVVQSQPTFAYQHLWHTTVQLSLWLALAYGVALALMQTVLHFILKPLGAIEKSAMDVQARRFEQIDQRPRAPELARVVSAMNLMSRRVADMLAVETARAQALGRQAYEDDMTGLANRRGFELRLAELLQAQDAFASGSVVSVELDDMRLLNRAQGFAAGEQIMRAVAEHARAVFAEAPVSILARSNEFSFNFVLVDLTQAQVAELAAELRRRLLLVLADKGHAEQVALNVGVAFFTARDQRSDVFARADLAVESARQSSRHGLVVMAAQPDEASSLGSAGWRTLIQTALTENRWQLVRQPVLRLDAQREPLQAECMARLVDAQGTLLPASQFMPMAARHRLMPEVDRAMVSLALAQMRQPGGGKVRLAINLSAQSAADAHFMTWLQGQLEQLGPLAERLAFEMSEFGVVRGLAAATRVRDLVRRHGGQFGMDQFGLDPSALTVLREMLPDYVKVSGSLMAELVAQPGEQDWLHALVTLAHSLEITVMALQVESADQVRALLAAQVDAGQGYHMAAPQ